MPALATNHACHSTRHRSCSHSCSTTIAASHLTCCVTLSNGDHGSPLLSGAKSPTSVRLQRATNRLDQVLTRHSLDTREPTSARRRTSNRSCSPQLPGPWSTRTAACESAVRQSCSMRAPAPASPAWPWDRARNSAALSPCRRRRAKRGPANPRYCAHLRVTAPMPPATLSPCCPLMLSGCKAMELPPPISALAPRPTPAVTSAVTPTYLPCSAVWSRNSAALSERAWYGLKAPRWGTWRRGLRIYSDPSRMGPIRDQ